MRVSSSGQPDDFVGGAEFRDSLFPGADQKASKVGGEEVSETQLQLEAEMADARTQTNIMEKMKVLMREDELLVNVTVHKHRTAERAKMDQMLEKLDTSASFMYSDNED